MGGYGPWDGYSHLWMALFCFLDTDSAVKIIQEFATIRCAKFDRMSSDQVRINYLRQQTETSIFKMSDEAYLWFAIQGIATEYPDLYNRSVTAIANKTLTWASLMAELQQLAVSQNKPVMTNIITRTEKTTMAAPKSVSFSDDVRVSNHNGTGSQ
jgi:hypothetical protein